MSFLYLYLNDLLNKIDLKKLDYFGISASLMCALHCSVLPLAIAGGFLSNSFLSGHGLVEYGFIIISVVIGYSSLIKSLRNTHQRYLPVLLFSIGLLCVFVGLRFHGNVEIILATLGGITIALAHFLNIKLNSLQPKFQSNRA
jgi:hypothetical protein